MACTLLHVIIDIVHTFLIYPYSGLLLKGAGVRKVAKSPPKKPLDDIGLLLLLPEMPHHIWCPALPPLSVCFNLVIPQEAWTSLRELDAIRFPQPDSSEPTEQDGSRQFFWGQKLFLGNMTVDLISLVRTIRGSAQNVLFCFFITMVSLSASLSLQVWDLNTHQNQTHRRFIYIIPLNCHHDLMEQILLWAQASVTLRPPSPSSRISSQVRNKNMVQTQTTGWEKTLWCPRSPLGLSESEWAGELPRPWLAGHSEGSSVVLVCFFVTHPQALSKSSQTWDNT